MTTATKAGHRKTAPPVPERTLHALFGALETAGGLVVRFAKDADAKLTHRPKKTARKASASRSHQ